MSKKFTSALLAVVMLATLLCLPACKSDTNRGFFANLINGRNETAGITGASYSKDYEPGTWAVYWYLCGTDLETQYGCATNDLFEMMEVTLPANVTVVIETGGTREWQNSIFDAGKRERYIYQGNDLKRVEVLPLASMGDPNTFAEFLFFCNDNYPAERQMLLLWDHGGGSLSGMEVDELYDRDILTLPEFRETIKAMPAASGAYELVGFDACLMATVEMTEILQGSARYLVASEEVEPGIGWDYKGMFTALSSDTGLDGAALGKAICDSYFTACGKQLTSAEVTLSVVDLQRSQALLAAYKAVGDEALLLAIEQKQPYFSDFGRAARDAESYGSGKYEMVDLGDLVELAGHLLPQNGQALLDALNDCVVYQVKGEYRSKASGLSCYYNLSGDPLSVTMYQSLELNKPYAYFHEYATNGALSEEAQAYINSIAQQAGQSVEITPLPPPQDLAAVLSDFPVSIGANGRWQLDLGHELASNLVGVFANLAWVDPENPDFLGWCGPSRSYLSSDYENGVFTESSNLVTCSIDGAGLFLEPITISQDYVLYASPILLNSAKYTMHIGYTDRTGKYEILGAWKDADETARGMWGIPSKNLHRLQPGDVVETFAYQGGDTDDTVPLGEFTVTGSTRVEETVVNSGYYYITFEMVDYAGNQYTSAPAYIRVRNGVYERLTGGLTPAITEQPADTIIGYGIEKNQYYDPRQGYTHVEADATPPFYVVVIEGEAYDHIAGALGVDKSSWIGNIIQIYSDTIDLERYAGMVKVYFEGDCYRRSTAYHRLEIVCNVTRIYEVW